MTTAMNGNAANLEVSHGSTASPAQAYFEFAARAREVVELELRAFFDQKTIWAKQHGLEVERMVAAVRDLTLRGGKRSRATLLAAGYHATNTDGPSWEASVRPAMLAIELLQTYLLIHDDWMDEDEMRRGGPTVHAMLRDQYGSPRQGEIGAILAGDFASSLALEAMAGGNVHAERRINACGEFARVQTDVGVGQLLDIRCAANAPSEVEAMHHMKTGRYTVEGPLVIGAMLAGATHSMTDALREFAGPLGIAFQLRDDLLGTFGNPAVTGKPVGTDLRYGKHTALTAEAASEPRVLKALQEVYGVTDAPSSAVERVIELLITSGVKARVEHRLAGLLDRATSVLAQLSVNEHGRRILKGAVLALATRDR
jgi:geranylgeranyl diphosphate synthase type I